MTKVTPFLMFNDQLEAAMEFYTATFPDSKIRNVARTGTDGPIASAEFVVGGQVFMGYNGGPHFTFSEGISFYVDCEDQAEVDEYWDKLVKAGATPTACGWIKDPFGISWQIVPRRFMELIRDRNPGKVKAVMDAMMTMVKLDVAALERAYNEGWACQALTHWTPESAAKPADAEDGLGPPLIGKALGPHTPEVQETSMPARKTAKTSGPAGRKPAKRTAAEGKAATPLPVSMVTGKASPAKAAVGDKPAFAYIASLPQPQRDIAERVDALAAKTLPGLQRSVKWGMSYYGIGDGWCFSCGGFADHVKLMFVNGAALRPVPPVTPVAMGKSTRGVELKSVDDLDERQIAAWMKQVTAVPGAGGKKR